MKNVYIGGLCKRGHEYEHSGGSLRRKPSGTCVECSKIGARKYIASHREDHNRKSSEWNKEWIQSFPLKYLCRSLKCRAKKSGLSFDLDDIFLSDLWDRQNGRCHWLGVPIDLHQTRKHPAKATLDRLVPAKGYTKDNVVWASNFANRGRVDLPVAQFQDFLKLMIEGTKYTVKNYDH